MAKKNKKNKKKRFFPTSSRFVLPVPGAVISEIEDLLAEDCPEEAIDLIEQWREKRQNHPALAFYLGSAHLMLNEYPEALRYLRLACRLDPRDEAALHNLFSTYLKAGHLTHGLRALKKYMRTESAREGGEMAALSTLRAELERSEAKVAAHFGVPADRYEEVSLWNEEGQIAQVEGDWEQAVGILSRALGRLPAFTPARNNRAQSYYFMGRIEEAIADGQEVVEKDPENIHALANLVRYHYVRGESRPMQDYFERLRALPEATWEHQTGPIHKLLEAWAVAGDDEEMYAFLERYQDLLPARGHYMLGAAAANLGKPDEARRIWEQVEEDFDWSDLAEDALGYLKDGHSGMGRASRFPYTMPYEWLDPEQLDLLMEAAQDSSGDPEIQRRSLQKFAGQHPAIFEVASWFLWYSDDPVPAVHLLGMLGTERAFAELKSFALGQAGEDEERMSAAMLLNEKGHFPEGQPVRLWHRGEWRDLLLKSFEITDQPEEREYSPTVYRLLSQVAGAVQEKRFDQAEECCHRILEHDPNCCAAYNHLASICSLRGDKTGMRQHLEKSLEIDPDFPTGRCNLALLYLEDGKVEEAERLVTPLLERRQLAQSELISYNVAMALIQLHRGNLEAVERASAFLLEIAPEEPMTQKLKYALEKFREMD